MGSDTIKPPEGFVLDTLPEGFVLDEPEQITRQINIDPEVAAKHNTSQVFGTIFGLDPNTVNTTYDNIVEGMYGEGMKPSQVQQLMMEDGFVFSPDMDEEDTTNYVNDYLGRKESPVTAKRQRMEADRQVLNTFTALDLADDIIFDDTNEWYKENIASKPASEAGTLYSQPVYEREDLLDFDTYVSILEGMPTKEQVEDLRKERKALLAQYRSEALDKSSDYFDTMEWSEFTTGSKVQDITVEAYNGLYTALKTIERGAWSTSVAMGMVWNQPSVEKVEEQLNNAKLTPMKAAGKIGFVTRAMSEAIPNLAYNMTVGGAGIFITEYGNARKDALNDGASDKEADIIALPVATINTIIEGFQLNQIGKIMGLGKGAKEVTKKMIADRAYKAFLKSGAKFTGESIKAAINEGFEGFLQEGVQIAIPAMIINSYPKDENGNTDWVAIGGRMGQSFIGEGLGGLALGMGGSIYNARNVQNYKNNIAGELIINEGLNPKQALEIANSMVERLQNNDGTPREIYREEVSKVKNSDNRQKAAAHIVKKGKEISDEQYRQIARDTTGKESMVDMTYEEGEKFVAALNEAKVEKVEPVEGVEKEEVTEEQINQEIEAIKNEPEAPVTPEIAPVATQEILPETGKSKRLENYTLSETINRDFAKLKEKIGEKKARKYFTQVDKLINPNKNEVIEYRENGVVTKEGDKYIFNALSDMDTSNWRISFKNDITEQFAQATQGEVSAKEGEITTLKALAEQIIDKKITGNRDQLVANWVSEKYKTKGLSESEIDKKIDSALRNFDNTIQSVERERFRAQLQPTKGEVSAKEVLKIEPIVKEAIENTPNAKITENGIELDLSRFQKLEQFGAQSIRTGVFYLPELKSPYAKYYKTGKYGYGGGEQITGRTTLRNPIIVKAGTGGKGAEKAYDAIEGKGSYQKMRNDVLSKVIRFNISKQEQIKEIEKILKKYGGKPELSFDIVRFSKEGNTLAYAIQEHIVAHAIRKAGYDSVLSYSVSAKKPRLSEVFDVRALEYPYEQTDYAYTEFYEQAQLQPTKGEVSAKEGEPITGKPFKTTAFHGTTEKGLTTEYLSPESAIETEGAIFFTSEEGIAEQFIFPREYGEIITEYDTGEVDEEGMPIYEEIEAGEILEANIEMNNPLVIEGYEAQQIIDDTGKQVRAVKEAKAKGYDGIILRDVAEFGDPSIKGDVYGIFDKSQIKPVEAQLQPTKGEVSAKEPWEMTIKEVTGTSGNLYYSPFKDLINLKDVYRNIQIPKQKIRDAERLFEAISTGDLKTISKIEERYFKAATKGEGAGVGPKQVKYGETISSRIGKLAIFGRGKIEQHINNIQQAISEGKPVPREVLEEYKGEAWADEALAQLKPTKGEGKTKTEQVISKMIPKARGGFLNNTPFGNKAKFQAKMNEMLSLITKPKKPEVPKKTLRDLKKTDTITTFTNIAEDAVKSLDRAFGVMSTRIKNISPRVFQEVRNKYVNPTKMIVADRTKKVHPFVDAIEKRFSEEDKHDFEVARWTEDIDTVESLIEKYGLKEEYDKYRLVFDLMYHEGKAVGMEMNYKTAYFPSKVKDFDVLLKELNRREEYAPVVKSLQEAQEKKGRDLTKEEQIQIIDTLLRGYRTTGVSLVPPGFTRARTLVRDDIGLIKYYYGFAETTSRYIESMTENIQARKFFGKQTKEIVQLRANISRSRTNIAKYEKMEAKDAAEQKKIDNNIKKNKDRLEKYQVELLKLDDGTLKNSVGSYVLDLINEGTINYDQQVELKQIFNGLFNTVGSKRWIHTARSLEYVGSLAQVPALMTQYSEIVLSILKSPDNTLPNWVRAHLNKSEITLADIGVAHIGQEWADADLNATMTKLMKGFEFVDKVGKETFINSVIGKYRKMAQTNPDKVRQELSKYYPESEHDSIIESLKSGVVDNNIKGFALNELADVQPISKMEVPELYAKAGNLRVFYMYKTFTLKRLDIMRNQAYNDIKGGIKSGSRRQLLKGLAKLVWLALMFSLADSSADVVKDIIRGKPLETVPDYIVDNLLQMILLSKYSVSQVKGEGLNAFIKNNIALPVSNVDAAIRDLFTLFDEDSEKGSMLARRIPWMGELYYWYMGEGARKVEEGNYD